MTILFRIIAVVIFIILITGLQLSVLYPLRKLLVEKKYWNKTIKIFFYSLIIYFNIPYLILFFYRINLNDFPQFIYYLTAVPFYIYQTGIIFCGLIFLTYRLITSPFSVTIFAAKKFRKLREKIDSLNSKTAVQKFDKSKRNFIRASGIAIGGYALIGAGYGVLKKDNYEIVKINIEIPRLAKELNDFTITLISDIHSGPFMSFETMKSYVDVINDLKSDIVLIPGDLTNSREEEITPFIKAFNNLKSRYGVFATLGNHDYFSNPDAIAKKLNEESVIKLLRNQSEILIHNGKPLLIVGAEDNKESGTKYSREIIENIDTAEKSGYEICGKHGLNYEDVNKILLYHKPQVYDEIGSRNYDLFVCGHTHGGQVVFADFGDLHLSIIAQISKYIKGLYKTGRYPMYISRGLGTVGVPMRLNCRPEITKFTLKTL